MWRGIATAVVLVYGYGHPVFNGYRPAPLDRALQGFHAEINGAVLMGRQALAQFDRQRARDMYQAFKNRVGSELSKN